MSKRLMKRLERGEVDQGQLMFDEIIKDRLMSQTEFDEAITKLNELQEKIRANEVQNY